MNPERPRLTEESLSPQAIVFLESLGEKFQPESALETKDGYLWFVYGEEQTGLPLVCLHSFETGVTLTSPLANRKKRTAAHKAWGGARQSRAPGPPWAIYAEMGEEGVDPDKKIGKVFSSYGHKSVGDMARIMIDAHNVPMHFCFEQFYDASTNAGQEKSTRYQPEFEEAVLQEIKHYLGRDLDSVEEAQKLEKDYQAIGTKSLELFKKQQERLTKTFTSHYKPKTELERTALASRVLDCARSFLLFGQKTGMSNDMSARDWSRYISDLKASPIKFYRDTGAQLERFLTPTKLEEDVLQIKAEAPSLIRHINPNRTTNDNLKSLFKYIISQTDLLDKVKINNDFKEILPTARLLSKEYTEGDKMVAQYLLTLMPGLDRKALLDWVHNQSGSTKQMISLIITEKHYCNNELSVLATTRGMTLVYEGSLGEARDSNRHRASGRFTPLPIIFSTGADIKTMSQILARGFTLPAYLTSMSEFRNEYLEFRTDLLSLYNSIFEFVKNIHKTHGDTVNYSFIYNILPLAHTVDLWMHLDPKGAHYMPDRRSRPGGHINYILQNAQASKLIAESDPYLSSFRLPLANLFSRENFFNRT